MRDPSRRAVMQDVVECMKREAAGARGNNRGGSGMTRRTMANLLHATVIGLPGKHPDSLGS